MDFKKGSTMFTLNRETLAQELSVLSTASEKKGTIPILGFVLIEIKKQKAKLTASDLDIFLATEMDASGDDWIGCVPFKQLYDFVKLLDKSADSVSFTPGDSRIQVAAARSKMKLVIDRADNFPQPEQVPTNKIAIDGQWLIPALSRVVVSASDERARLHLSGVLLEHENETLAIVATDQHRMSYSEIPLEASPFKVFLPRSAVLAISKLEANELFLSFNDSVAQIVAGPRVLTTRLLVAQFPNWRGVLPKSPKYIVEAATGEIQAAIRRASVTLDRHRAVDTTTATDAIRLRFAKDTLTIETAETDKGHSEEIVEVSSNMNGESVLAGFNKQYLEDALSGVGNQVEISFTDANSQMKVRPLNSDSIVHIVMPCRI